MDIKRQLAVLRNKDDHSAESINVITDIKTRFKDLVGCDSEVTYMTSIIDMLVNKENYEKRNITVPKGALMEGLPDTGKTFIASAMAGELQERFEQEAPDKRFGFMSFSASELANRPVSYIASIFNTAEEYDACIMFIDEVDAIAKKRSENQFHDRYLELIKQMDGVEKRSNVFILAATNAPDQLDRAFVRSGRIDKRLKFTLPDETSLKELARRAVNKRKKTLANVRSSEDLEGDIEIVAGLVAKRTRGFTAGDIDNIINNAYIAYHQFKNYKDKALPSDFFKDYPFIRIHVNGDLSLDLPVTKKNITAPKNNAMKELYAFIDEEIERKMMGTVNFELRDEEFHTDVNDESCSSTSIHEVGHALVSLIQGGKPFNTITILSRGKALGYVAPAEVRLLTKADFKNRIRTCMGGRAAEELFYGKDNVSVGAKQDMLDATNTARAMVEKYGFSEEFGFMALSNVTDEYLGGSKQYLCSEEGRAKIDETVNKLLKELYAETLVMLSQNKSIIEKLAKTVFEKKTMTGDEFDKLWKQLSKKR